MRLAKILRTIRPLLLLTALAVVSSPSFAEDAPPADAPPTLSDEEARAFLSALSERSFRRKVAEAEPERLRVLLGEVWADFPQSRRDVLESRIEYARAEFGEGERSGLLTHRGVVFIALGPPSRIHEEPARAWSGDTVPDLSTQEQVQQALDALKKNEIPELPTRTVDGSHPTHAWVHSIPDVADRVRVLLFTSEAGDGAFRLAKLSVSDATAEVSTAKARELPASVFEQVGAGQTFEELPEVAEDALTMSVTTSMFKAAESKTHVRFVVPVDPSDAELEFDVDPDAYVKASRLWLRVADGDTVLFQDSRGLEDGGLTAQGSVYLAEFGVPVLPGKYQYTAVLVDGQGRGGSDSGDVEVAALSGTPALSDVVLARAVDGGLPKAAKSGEGSIAPFQVGSYTVRPQVGSTFKRGDTLAVVVQVYNAPSAVLEYDIWYEGSYQGTLDPVSVKRLPSTEIQLIDVVDAWPDGSYKVVVTAAVPGKDDQKVVAETRFRVRG